VESLLNDEEEGIKPEMTREEVLLMPDL